MISSKILLIALLLALAFESINAGPTAYSLCMVACVATQGALGIITCQQLCSPMLPVPSP